MFQTAQMCFYLAVVDAEELIRSGGHVDIVRLSFGTLPVQKLVDRFILRGILEQGGHDLEQGLTEPAGSTFGSFVALCVVSARTAPHRDRHLQKQ